MRTLRAFAVFAVFAALPLLAQTTPSTEADVMRAVLQSQQRVTRLRANKVILLAAATSTFAIPAAKIADELRADYKSKNEKAATLAAMQPPVKVADVASLRGANGYDWQQVVARYPDADLLVELSRPGFDRSQNTAVISATLVKPSGAKTYLYSLRRQDGQWVVDHMEGPF
ncbi:MAG TPA: hypothetical protein VGR02_00175 [Thermoanaerobaculia bacterium]|jgi:hypothetical protein|nr:hypothetical protein [Thermoanaerobaculia bacterium]